MVHVTLERDKDICRVKSKGHATGSVEVCAAVSTLVYSLVAYLDLSENAKLISVNLSDGDAEVAFSGGKSAFDMFVAGINLLARDHSDFVTVNWAETEG